MFSYYQIKLQILTPKYSFSKIRTTLIIYSNNSLPVENKKNKSQKWGTSGFSSVYFKSLVASNP